ncbi:MAG: hypothetical protein ACRD3B_00235, partial [Candidatus Sulfotelmatobacter sp.]
MQRKRPPALKGISVCVGYEALEGPLFHGTIRQHLGKRIAPPKRLKLSKCKIAREESPWKSGASAPRK